MLRNPGGPDGLPENPYSNLDQRQDVLNRFNRGENITSQERIVLNDMMAGDLRVARCGVYKRGPGRENVRPQVDFMNPDFSPYGG